MNTPVNSLKGQFTINSVYFATINPNKCNRVILRSSRNENWGAVTYSDIGNRSHFQCHWICFLFFWTLSSEYQPLHYSEWRPQTRWSLQSATRSTQLEDWCGCWCFSDRRISSWSSVHNPWLVFCCSFFLNCFFFLRYFSRRLRGSREEGVIQERFCQTTVSASWAGNATLKLS